ncbi:M28 family peptidase [candidate division KSB1 bacterium]|nr:M28 family peptidase [candidate division KSB1 bacterium]TDI86811.1 MAG: Zn-dependent exopeptidase M28 [Caldithrix sp.]
MRQLIAVLFALLIFLPTFLPAQTESFNADSAYVSTKHLSVTIGPRPMGSANEQAALLWAKNKFAGFGADSAYVMKFTKTKTRAGMVNTNSGTSVGIFRGETDSTIVIGGHIDSSGPEIPGANDNASGTACVIELARIWSQASKHYTFVFAAFGAEENGLLAAKHFVDNYPGIDNVALMLQIDMAGSEDDIIILSETPTHKAPQWLVEDAFAIDRALGFNSLRYEINFMSINNALSMASSDHAPFLDKNIPAIDFTAGVNSSPIHTSRDKFDFISKSALNRSGQIVNSMLQKYETEGIPAPRGGNYLLWPAFGSQFFLPSWTIPAINILALLLGILAFMHSRKNRLRIDKPERVRFSGTKLFLMLIIMAVFTQLGEAALQFIKGLRYPWLVHFDKYMWLAAICTIGGIWVTLQLTKRWRFSPDSYVYTKRAFIGLSVFIAFLGMASMRLALYPALTMIFISLAILIPNPIVKLILSFLAPYPMFKLMFMEELPFLARSLTQGGAGIDSTAESLLFSTAITLLLVLWYLPGIYAYSNAVVSSRFVRDLVKTLRRPLFGLMILLAAVGFGGYLYSLPSYNEEWTARIRVNADYNVRSGENRLQLLGNEYFRNVSVQGDSLTRQYDVRIHKDDLAIPFTAEWIDLTGEELIIRGEKDTVNVNWLLTSTQPWYLATLRIQTDSLEIIDVFSEHAFNHRKNQVSFSWTGQPSDTIRFAAEFTLARGANLIRTLTGRYTCMPIPIKVSAELADIAYRTTVVYRDTLLLGEM